MAEPIRLITSTEPPAPVSEEVVEHLETLLEKAKAGEFNSIMTATLTSHALGHYTAAGTGWAGHVRENVHIALGALDVLKQRMLNELLEW